MSRETSHSEDEQSIEESLRIISVLTSLETVPYELQSHRRKILQIPQKYAEIAQGIVHHIITGEGSLPIQAIEHHLTRENVGLVRAFAELADSTKGPRVYGEPFEYFSKEALQFQDELYLRICINLNERRMSSADRENAHTLDLILIEAVKGLKE